MKQHIAISVSGLAKTYKLYHTNQDRVKEALHPFRKKYHVPFHALSDVSFEVPKGMTMGIIGRNGSGKSTLLQIICGIVPPTSGVCEVHGRISAILELGAGFNPEFTGRQNVFLNGAILGLTHQEITERFEAIERFADISHFIDQPVKTYSSGMYVRLAFAVAINVDPDILVVDEALAVGDVYYQHKCMHRMKTLMQQGVTIIFVSHDLGSVKSLCSQAILLDNGRIAAQGNTEIVVNAYYYQKIHEECGIDNLPRENSEQIQPSVNQPQPSISSRWDFMYEHNADFVKRNSELRSGSGDVKVQNAELLNDKGIPVVRFIFEEMILVRIYLEFFQASDNTNVGFIIRDKNGNDLLGTNLFVENKRIGFKPVGSRVVVDFSFRNILRHGSYSISFGVGNSDELGKMNLITFDWVDNALVFESHPKIGKHVHTIVLVPVEIEIHE